MEQQGKQVSIDDETVKRFLKEVMDMESKPSFEIGAQKNARRDKITELLEKYSPKSE